MEIRHRTSGEVLLDTGAATLEGAHLLAADLREADLHGESLAGADLSDANLAGAALDGADLSFAGLMGANLSGASLVAAKLNSANLSGADLFNTDLSGADLTDAVYNVATRWPEGFDPVQAGAALAEETEPVAAGEGEEVRGTLPPPPLDAPLDLF
jgi:hypothetical protein